jgi:DNA repair protein RadC
MILPASPVDAGVPDGDPGASSRAPRRSRPFRSGRARLLAEEAPRLADQELLELLLEPGLGPDRARMGAARLLHGFPAEDGRGPLRRLGRAAPSEMARVGRITPAAAARVVAALELGRRFAMEQIGERCRLGTALDVYERFYPRMRDLQQEEFWVAVLNTQHELLREVMVGRGTPSGVLVRSADVLRPAIQEGGSAIVVVHNHPSGEPTASLEDKTLTRRLAEAAAMLGLELWDHVIIGERRYESFRESGMLRPDETSRPRGPAGSPASPGATPW